MKLATEQAEVRLAASEQWAQGLEAEQQRLELAMAELRVQAGEWEGEAAQWQGELEAAVAAHCARLGPC